MPTTTAPTLRSGVASLLGWLTRHPGIPVAYISHADDECAELSLHAGRWDALITVEAANAKAGA